MLTAKDKHVVVGADFAGHPLKEAVKAHLVSQIRSPQSSKM